MTERKPDLRRAATYALASAAGAVCAGAVLALSAWLMYALQLPLSLAQFLSLFSLGAGCMLSGFLCGRIKRHGGLRVGFVCAVILLSVCLLISLLRGSATGAGAIAKTLTAVLTGCTGGVLGVNKR